MTSEYFTVAGMTPKYYPRAMSVRPILIIPHPNLKQVAAPIDNVTEEVRKLADDMLETMYDAPGIGLAGPQIGEMRRLIVLDISRKVEARESLTMINPEIIWSSQELSSREEGCLSIPEFREDVERPRSITVRFLDRDGGSRELSADGILATCIQHEIDHLNGVLFIDRISKLKRDLILRKFKKKRKADLARADNRLAYRDASQARPKL